MWNYNEINEQLFFYDYPFKYMVKTWVVIHLLLPPTGHGVTSALLERHQFIHVWKDLQTNYS